MTGIYKIENIKNNKVYIGKSLSIENRWRQHIKELNDNAHHCVRLQYDYNKYNCTSFIFSIVEVCNEDELKLKESYYIEYYFKQLDGNIYNTQISLNQDDHIENTNKPNHKNKFIFSNLEYNNKTLNSRKIVNYILTLPASNYYELGVIEISNLFNISSPSIYRDYGLIIDDLNNIYIDGKNVFEATYENGVFIINKNLNFKTFSRSYTFEDISNFKSNNSMKLINNIITNNNSVIFTISELRDYFNINGSTYDKYSNIKQKWFNQFQKDFSGSNIKLNIREIKKGRKIIKVEFSIEK